MYKHIVKHFYRIVLSDKREIRVSKSDFDYLAHTRGEDGEFVYRTIVRTRKIDSDTDSTDYIHIIDEK